MEQGEARSLPSGEAETNPYLLGETDPAPPGSGEAESIPQPSGEAELVHERWVRRNQTPIVRARSALVLLSVQEFLTFDGY